MKKRNDRQKSDTNTVQETTLAQDLVQLLLKIVLLLLVVYYRLDHRFISGDVAVFEKDNKTTTGRVVAVAGDTVDITKDGLMINGAEQISQDIYFDTTRFKNGVDFPLTVKEGQIFVLGDNRPKASDSRIYGCIDLKDIRGKVIAIIRSRGI